MVPSRVSTDLDTNETILFTVWIIVIFVVLPVMAAAAAWLTARLVYSRHDSDLAVDHYRLRKYACRSCGHGFGHHINPNGEPIGCLQDHALLSAGCACNCFIGTTPPDKLMPLQQRHLDDVTV